MSALGMRLRTRYSAETLALMEKVVLHLVKTVEPGKRGLKEGLIGWGKDSRFQVDSKLNTENKMFQTFRSIE